MSEYINKDELVDTLDECIAKCEETLPLTPAQVHEIRGEINATKAIRVFIKRFDAADVREVVTCAECSIPHNKYTGCPKLNGLVTPTDFFCAFGRKNDER